MKNRFSYILVTVVLALIILFSSIVSALSYGKDQGESGTAALTNSAPATSAPQTTAATSDPAVITTVPVTSAPPQTDKQGYELRPLIPEGVKKIVIGTTPAVTDYKPSKTENFALYNATNDILICSSDLQKRVYPASTTKLLTALYALTLCSTEEEVLIGPEIYMIAPDSSKSDIKVKEKFTFGQLLYCLLLPSGNDAAYAIANFAGRKLTSEPEISDFKAISLFMEGVNEYAKAIGMENTHFVTPDGYHSDNHYTCLYDMLVLAKAVLSNPDILAVTSTYKYSFTNLSGKTYSYTNTNSLFNPDASYYTEGLIGLKTGHTSKAGYCLVSAAKRNGKIIIALTYGVEKSADRNADAHRLIEYGFAYKK